ncbi:MAG: biosynthetic arginine decarboxylase [Sorangiineae bacterium]|nr:biosynthetic arginine decarboxylase [Polyangiaceae bacterium]MEB2320929.1 biosynthetic arginine decarboxylase [Sorangiineae bacterium]
MNHDPANAALTPATPNVSASERSNGHGASPEWTTARAAVHYQVSGWGAPYFCVNERGQVEVHPDPTRDGAINLYELTQDLKARGIELPLLIRFSDIIAHRIRRINECFQKAIAEYEYGGTYRGVYPVKVNQQRHLVEEVVEYGRAWQFGLEAGSKPELLIALAAMQDAGGLIICNGYKDLKYIETALVAQKFDKTVIIVLERIEELGHVFFAAEKLGIKPILGVRAKLTAKGVGRWADSAGDRAKFGLTTAEIIEVVDRLAERGMLDCLKLLHFHIGSQISSIIPIKNAIQEASNIYVELAKMGCQMGYIDVGGGLAIDYDGSKTDFHASKNYTLAEYAADIVGHIQGACSKAEVPVPTIVSESGRAIAAHHSVLVFEVVGKNEVRFGAPIEPRADAHRLLRELYETYKGVAPKNVQESFHDASQAKEEAQSLFRYGYLTLRERAQAERLYWHVCEKIQDTLRRLKFVPEELYGLERTMSAIYYGNFSVFQSVPDVWAIDQLFPIMPIHRLDEEPTVNSTLADLTCDSDGTIDHFIDVEDVRRTLDVHPLRPGEPYTMGIFLNGAYQEILGDLHNLFGDTNAVHVRAGEGSSYTVRHVVKGDSISDVLRYVEYVPENMIEAVRHQAERAVSAGRLTNEQMRTMMQHYEQALRSYTYLTEDD